LMVSCASEEDERVVAEEASEARRVKAGALCEGECECD
jgi:hypothetical protein